MKAGLIRGRHKMPSDITKYIYECDIPSAHMADGEYLKSIAESFIERFSPSLLEIYVTGFTPALCAVLSICKARDIKVICWHYDRSTGVFWRQDL